MYLGFALILAGIAIVLGSLTPVLIIPLFVLAMDRWYISFEEQALAGKFGAAWQKYKLSTRRWL
jgi:protein-S-isoprenylcysteine O-methyltransferase Ste14